MENILDAEIVLAQAASEAATGAMSNQLGIEHGVGFELSQETPTVAAPSATNGFNLG